MTFGGLKRSAGKDERIENTRVFRALKDGIYRSGTWNHAQNTFKNSEISES